MRGVNSTPHRSASSKQPESLRIAKRRHCAKIFEFVPYGGAVAWRLGTYDDARFAIGSGLRWSRGPASLIGTAEYDRHEVVRASVGIGYAWRAATLHIGLARTYEYHGGYETWSLGSVQELGLAALPLLAVRVSPHWSVDFHAAMLWGDQPLVNWRQWTGGLRLSSRW